MKTFVIAEAGSCHDGSLEQAYRLIATAKEAGADACKFQFWSDAARLATRRRAPAYQPLYEKYRVPRDWLDDLKTWCDAAGLEFMCTVYLPEDVPVIAPYVARFKIASFEADDLDFIAAHVPYDKPILVSTGMSSETPHPYWKVKYLHCVSAYPTPIDEANLAVLRDPGFVGFSDHTADTLTGAFAVCASASILEVHFRLDDTDTANPDYVTALDPAELAQYVRYVRLAERLLGSPVKRIQPSEAAMVPYKVACSS